MLAYVFGGINLANFLSNFELLIYPISFPIFIQIQSHYKYIIKNIQNFKNKKSSCQLQDKQISTLI